MAYEKLLNEIYAVLSLKYLWRDYRPCFVKSESPDWVNENMELGVEVSQALLPDDGQTASFIENYLGCRREELPVSALERYGQRLHFYNGRFWAVLPADGCQQDDMYKAKYRFERKLEKLNTNYRKMRYNGLYLFLHPADGSNFDASGLYAYMKERQQHTKRTFDWVFLNCGKVIYVCNYRADSMEAIDFPRNAENFLNVEAERLRQCRTWEDGTPLDG